MPRTRVRTPLLLVAALAIAACTDAPTQPTGPGAALTRLPRDLTPAERSIITASNAFSFALFGKVSAARRDSNVFLSPLSASMALGMTLNGAANGTYDEMRTALQFGDASQSDIDAGYKSLIALLTSLDPHVQLRIANSIWYDRTFPFNQGFLDTATTYFGATVRPLDFNDAAASVAAINGWVNEATNGKIPKILDGIDPAQVMFLIDAIYFKGDWRTKFDVAQSVLAPFWRADGTVQNDVQFMHRHATMRLAQGPFWAAVDLPYGDSAYSMTVVLPLRQTTVEQLADSLCPRFWSEVTSSFHSQDVELFLPKLTLRDGRKLNDDLQALGMRSAFEPGVADFTRMSSLGSGLYVDNVTQKTYVSINEDGTEAAAVTQVGVSASSLPAYPVLWVARPYLFVIHERLTGTVLFMAKIVSVPPPETSVTAP